jgi:hypothetical protein
MRSGVHALALLALLAAAPAQAFITGESAAPSALVSASLGLRLRGGGKPADGKVRLRLRVQIWKHIDKHACLLLAPPPALPGESQTGAPPSAGAYTDPSDQDWR